jgi:hypothetical protein
MKFRGAGNPVNIYNPKHRKPAPGFLPLKIVSTHCILGTEYSEPGAVYQKQNIMHRFILYFLFLLSFNLAAQNTNLSGFVSTEDGAFVSNVDVNLFDDQGQLITSTVTVNGRYTFTNLPSGYDYTVQFSKSGSPLNGLSTYDFVIISRHLLAVAPLTDPKLILAADIDGSNSISISDLFYLRQLILGIANELPGQRNWLFLAEDQTPSNPQQVNTFTFNLSGSSVMKNFLIFKIGDMNKTADFD